MAASIPNQAVRQHTADIPVLNTENICTQTRPSVTMGFDHYNGTCILLLLKKKNYTVSNFTFLHKKKYKSLLAKHAQNSHTTLC